MFVRSIMFQEKWKHRVDRHSPVVSLPMRLDIERCTFSDTFLRVDNVCCYFTLSSYRKDNLRFYYALEVYHGPCKFTREVGEFTNFDSVSVVFGGLRFHWSRESGKIIISDAPVSRRDFDPLTIE